MNTQQTPNHECCPEFHPEKWDKKTFQWDNKLFIKETIPTLFHIPYPPMIGKTITGMWKMAEAAKATPANKEDGLVLFTDPSAFKSEIYISVTASVPGANNVTISGTFVSMAFEGSYNTVPKHIKQMEKYLAETGKKAGKFYIHYAYCPGCAKKFGHNYMILFAEVQ
jgi:hypothetical protein